MATEHPDQPDAGGDQHPDDEPTAPEAPAGDTPAAASSAAGPAGQHADSRRLALAVAILALIAIVAVGIGISRKNSAASSGETAGTTSSTTTPSTTAGGTKGSGGRPGTTVKDAPPSSTASSSSTAPACGDWPVSATGKPAFSAAGVYVWNEGGWRIRVVSPADKPVTVTGTVTGVADLDAKAFKVAPNVGEVTTSANVAKFTLKSTPDGKDGIDFAVTCKVTALSFTFIGQNGQPVAPATITVGHDHKAVANPVVLERQS